jgi:small subunit ribosomal protein S2
MFSGIVSLRGVPGAIFVVDPKHEAIAVKEAKQLKIPVIALANTDCNIANIDYPIVANDSNLNSINFFVSEIAEALNK